MGSSGAEEIHAGWLVIGVLLMKYTIMVVQMWLWLSDYWYDGKCGIRLADVLSLGCSVKV